MAPTSAVRSFAITLAIAITIIGPQASGFTINRTQTITSSRTDTPSTDLSSDESFQLSVKDDLKRPNDIKTKDGEVSNKSTKSSNSTETTTDTMKNNSEWNTTKILPIAYTEIRSTTEDTRIPTISSDTVEVFDSLEDLREHIYNYNTTEFSTGPSVKDDQLDLKQTASMLLENTHTATTMVNFSETQFSTEITTFIDQIATESETTGNQSTTNASLPIQQDLTTAKWNNFDTSEMTTESTETSTSKKIAVSAITAETEINSSADTAVTDLLPTLTTSSEYITTPTEVQQYQTFSDSNMTDTTTDDPDTKITEPLWKKYTTIVRKRVSSSEDTSQTAKTEDDAMKAETSNTHESFEKVFNVTPIPSLEEFTVNLLSDTNQPTIKGETVSEDIGNITMAHESTMPSPHTVISTGAKRTGTVQTKRAGYLDNSEKGFTPTSVLLKSTELEHNDTNLYGTVKNIDALVTERPDSRKVSGSESLSQMAADAIQEELLREEALNLQENINRYRDEKTENEKIKPIKEANPEPDTTFTTDETLSVQPINHERTKTTLYTVSPNYKPMKKIDVQPSKPFVRDPDDNSWRNESISSLGIVFKPKNSSKSFKEILKNKTQTELNNLLERDTKDDVPDLRVRLEKIAEVRKTKKKKMNKDGVEVYTDYEEGNSDESSKPESISSVLSSAETSKLLTSSKSQSNPDLTTPMTIWNEMEANNKKTMNTKALFKNLGIDPFTTQKPNKLYNIAEYYDTTDEYDADYVTMSKLDLQKFVPSRTTQTPVTYPIGPPPTKPMKSLFPDRKPTVQYFPPRTPQQVNVNNVDTDFERKINLYTFKNPKIEPHPPFVTVAPVPIATIKPDLVMRPDIRPDIRPTVKPIDFTMYTPTVLNKNYYLTNAPRMTEPHESYVINDESLNRGSFVIKHYRDFLAAAAKDNDDDRSSDFMAIHTQTASPRDTTVTDTDVGKATPKGKDEDYDYDLQFRKQLLSHFVDNFNQNSERFKVDFPILYNNSVVHRKMDENGRALASSRAYLKRLYGNEGTATKTSNPQKKPCEPNCDLTVELSPAYELHYYVPEQEEKQEMEPRAATAPYRLAL